jgi:tetratricopeptide (TPR) repeat protein
MAMSTLKLKVAVRCVQEGAGPAHLALAESLERIGRCEEAIVSYEAAIRSDTSSLPAWLGLARALLTLGRAGEAFRHADQALLIDMDCVEGWRLIAESLEALGEIELCSRALERTLSLTPHDADLQLRLGRLYETLDRPFDAAARYQRALALKSASEAAQVEAHVGLSGLFGRAYQFEQARRHAEAALALEPGHRGAHQNLAAVSDAQDFAEEAEAHRERAYRGAPLIVTRAAIPRRRVLTLASAARANSPDRYLIPSSRYDRLLWFIAYADDAVDPGQGYDVVFNAIADADAVAPLHDRLSAFAAHCGRPLLNRPDRILRTARDRLADLFVGVADLMAPRTRRVRTAADLAALAADRSWLLRPLGSHGGERLQKLTRDEAAARLDGREHYLTAFHDYRSDDGFYRKYRVFFVDRKPYPYHLAIHDHWLVHYQPSRTPRTAEFREEERRFLEAPAETLGARAYGAICEIGRRMDLDFAGVDFTVLPDGRALLFEANATMLAHPEAADGPLAYKNPFVARIIEAFQARLESA